eukprot:m.35859 g.35859  ORF g.35859 m.35859 type:complete len:331 (+) comp12426_c0_seq1:114-1106(+)
MAEANVAHPQSQTLQWANDNKELVLFVQEVICLRRPRWYLGLIGGCHVIWYLLFLTTKPVLAKLSIVSLSLVLGNAALNQLRHHDLLGFMVIPSPLPASTDNDKWLPLRTLPQLSALFDSSKLQCRQCIDHCRDLHQRSPGQLTFLMCALCLVMIFVFEHVPAWAVAYVGMLSLLALPALERFLPARKLGSKAAPVIQTTTATTMGLLNRFFERLPDEIIVVGSDSQLTSPIGSHMDLSSVQPSRQATNASFNLNSPEPSDNSTMLDLSSSAARTRGWSVLHDTHDDLNLDETRSRGWSVLHDDGTGAAPASPGLHSSETEEGFQNISYK